MKLIMSDVEYYKYDEPVITLEYCPMGGFHCHDTLKKMNRLLSEANLSLVNKEYDKAIELKVRAFEVTYSLTKSGCDPCGDLLRKNLLRSIDENLKELKRITSGFFRNRKYLSQLKKAEESLARLHAYRHQLISPKALKQKRKV